MNKGKELNEHVNKLLDQIKEYKNRKIPINKGKLVKLTKISDHIFGNKHPNNINTGYIKIGIEMYPPKVGISYYLTNFHTSVVTKIINETTFITLNSTYKIEYLDESKKD